MTVIPRWAALAATLLLLMAGVAEARPKVGVVALGLWSDQGVFRSEASRAAALLTRRFGRGPVVVRANTARAFTAGPAGMASAIAAAGRGLDPGRDVLFVVLTSHGSPDGIAEKGGGTQGLLAPGTVGAILSRSPVRHKALIVSACFSGIFTPLASPDLLVITAADARHPSFGCEAGATWTYFGRAFFDQALRESVRTGASLDAVFARAAALVRARELSQGFEPSNPQIAGGSDVLRVLAEP